MSGTRRKVVHLSTAHQWDDSRIFRRMCLSLARNGIDVVLIAGADAERVVGGVRVVPIGPPRGRLGRLAQLPKAAWKGLASRADIIHLHDPELIPLIPVLRLGRAKIVYDAHEDLAMQVLSKEYLPPAIRPAVAALSRALCWLAGSTAHHVVAASEKVAERFPSERCTVVRNYPEEIPENGDAPPYDGRDNVVIYAGGLSSARGAEQMVDAMQHASLPAEWRLLLIGPQNPDDLMDQLSVRPGWTRADYGGIRSPNEARKLIGTARIGLSVLQPVGQHVDALPTKVLEYMSLGVPVISAAFPECRAVIESADCGLLVDPTDPRAIGTAISALANDPERARAMGERGRAAVKQRYSWTAEERRLLAAYDRLIP
jgi:glycosyltransferase involved in cell wall biosynthesis